MSILQRIFQTILTLSLVGGYVTILVLLVRLLLRKAPGWCAYALWGVVFLRLCCPVFPETAFSLIPSQLAPVQNFAAGSRMEGGAAALYEESRTRGEDQIVLSDQSIDMEEEDRDAFSGHGTNMTIMSENTGEISAAEDKSLAENIEMQNVAKDKSQPENAGALDAAELADVQNVAFPFGAANSERASSVLTVLSCIWLAGMLGCMAYHSYSYGRLRRRVRGARETEPGVREIAGGHLSFVMGIFRPVIYLSSGLEGESRRVVLCHEQVHLKRKDYLIKPAALAICCVHWFNPLVWLAFHMMNWDCEISCDERVISLLGEESKKIYSYTLLNQAAGGQGNPCRKGGVCALLSFGEDNIKARVKHVLHYRRASSGLAVGAVIVLCALLAGLCSNPRRENRAEQGAEGQTSGMEGLEAGNTQAEFQTSPERALNRFAVAYGDRDGDALYALCLDKEAFEAWNEVIVPEESQNGARYVFGGSSPWVETFTIDYQEGSDEAVIRFILTDSSSEHYIKKERVRVTQQEGLYYVDHMESTSYHNIASRRELEQIYDLEAEHPFDYESTGYSPSCARTFFYHIVKETNPQYYAAYQDPVTAARRLLHLGEGTGEVTETLYQSKRQNPYGYLSSTQYAMYGEGTVVNLRYTFAEDGSFVDIPMVLAEESMGVWMLSNGDLSAAEEQDIGALPGDNARKTYGEYADYDGDGIWDSANIGSYSGEGVACQISDYGVYRLARDYQCICPIYIPWDADMPVDFWEGKVYFPVDSRYSGGDDYMHDSICEVNLETSFYRFIPLSENAQLAFPLSWLHVSDGMIRLCGTDGIYAFPLGNGEPVWEGLPAAELTEEEKAVYGVLLRQYLLSHPNEVLSVGSRTDSNTFALIDLDGDGAAEEIILTPINDGQGDGSLDHYKLQCGEGFEVRYGENMVNDIWAYSPDGENIFIALLEEGSGDGPLTTLFAYEYNRLDYAGELEEDIRSSTIER